MKKTLTLILLITSFNSFSCHKKSKEIPVPVVDILKWIPEERFTFIDILGNIQYPEMPCEDEICI